MAKTKDKKKPAEVFKGDTHIGIVIDRSGSMIEIQDEVVSGFNAWRADLLDKAADLPGKTLVTMNQFDTEFDTIVNHVPAAGLPKLTLMIKGADDQHRFEPRGMTALLDAIGLTILQLDVKQDPNDRFLLVIMTDGKENSSIEYTKAMIDGMIADRKKIGNWTVVFLGSDLHKADKTNLMVAAAAGRGNTQTYDPSVKGATAAVLRHASVGTQAYMLSPKAATENFMQPAPGDATATIQGGNALAPTGALSITPKKGKKKA
jgi:hypothetical protein